MRKFNEVMGVNQNLSGLLIVLAKLDIARYLTSDCFSFKQSVLKY